jgi:predicted nucleic acid-binding protein
VIVADANVLVTLWLGGRQAALAESARLRDPHWVVPRLWRSEFRNAVLGMIRARLVTPDDAAAVMRDVEETMGPHEYDVVTRDVLELALRSGCTAYDCEYVALAEALDVHLVTFDRELQRAFPERAVAPEVFVRD